MSADPTNRDDTFLHHSLQIESLRRTLPEGEETDERLRQLQRHRENLDAVVYALSSHQLRDDRRRHLLEILKRQRGALEQGLSALGIEPRPARPSPLWHYHQLDPEAREHLAAILDVPEEQAYYEVLDIKAEEYLAQQRAFEAITAEDGFRERKRLPKNSKRGALALTLSGSLIQLSAPGNGAGRRYLYQNIYGNAHPPQGMLILDQSVELGKPICSVELTTSPVCQLRVADRAMSWKMQSVTFDRLARTFTSLASRSEGDLALADSQVRCGGLQRRFNAEAAERVLYQEYREDFDRFDRLRPFISAEDAERSEAELLTICHVLQRGARELGFDARTFEQASEISTADGKRYALDAKRKTITRLSSGSGLEVTYAEVSLGRQLLTCRAPLALIGHDGSLLEVIDPIARIR